MAIPSQPVVLSANINEVFRGCILEDSLTQMPLDGLS
jgi:hypothetical protein